MGYSTAAMCPYVATYSVYTLFHVSKFKMRSQTQCHKVMAREEEAYYMLR